MGKCKEPNCTNPPFNEYCRYHQFRLYMKGERLYKPKKPIKKPIPKESKKRKEEHKAYLQKVAEFWDNAVNTKTNYCIFCGKYMDKREDNHHVRNRGNMYLEDSLWACAHRKCHNDYHFVEINKLMKEPWYNDFLIRLKAKDEIAYKKEMRKYEKSHKLNPILDFDDDIENS